MENKDNKRTTCTACNNKKAGVRTNKFVPHTCGTDNSRNTNSNVKTR